MIQRRGFTLIELLVVVAIIALLIAILLPSLSRAKANAVRVKCAAVLKQWNTAIHMYAQEQYDWFGIQWTNTDGSGTNHVWTSISPNSTSEIYDAEWTSGGTNTGWRISGGLHTCPGDPAFGQVLDNPNTQTTAFRPPCDYTMVRYQPAQSGVLMWRTSAFNHPSTTLLMCDQPTGRTAGSFSISTFDDLDSTTLSPNFTQSLQMRHLGIGNASFLDGHVEAHNYQDFKNNIAAAATPTDYTHTWAFQNLP
jgi:prepilin-type N-terminal cleavage/methylation domain-containing protein/prepilin-type processing-associated H-X9-DG protein